MACGAAGHVGGDFSAVVDRTAVGINFELLGVLVPAKLTEGFCELGGD